jgi:hypothetical protein
MADGKFVSHRKISDDRPDGWQSQHSLAQITRARGIQIADDNSLQRLEVHVDCRQEGSMGEGIAADGGGEGVEESPRVAAMALFTCQKIEPREIDKHCRVGIGSGVVVGVAQSDDELGILPRGKEKAAASAVP